MSRQILQTRRFARHLKRLPVQAVADVYNAIYVIAQDPHAAQPGFVDLAALRIHRFTCKGEPFLLGYLIAEDIRLIHLEADRPLPDSALL